MSIRIIRRVILFANATRPGTVFNYKSAWRKWDSRRKIDPIICPIRDVVQFLTEFFQKGFKYNTITGFGSAISAYHDPIQGISVDNLLGFLIL